MSDHQSSLRNASLIRELVTRADVTALNTALADHAIDARDVISIIFVAGTAIAGGPGDRYRVLYRAAA